MYDEVDIKKILARAAELQTMRSGPGSGPVSDSRQKLTLKEIEEIAGELDLSPEYVREAALEYEGIPNKEPLFLDTGNKHEVELMGHANGTLDQKTWAELRSIIEYHFDCPGQVKRRPLGIIWEARPQGILKFLQTRKSPKVEVKSTGNTSTIRIKQSLQTYNKLLWFSYAALGGAAMLLAVAMVEEAPEALFFSAGLLLMAKLFHRWTHSKKKKAREYLKDTMDQLQTIITRRFSAAEKGSTAQKQVLIDLDEKEEEEEAVEEEVRSSSKGKIR